MFTLRGSRTGTTCDGASRRDFLKAGVLGLGGLALPDLLRLRAADAARGKPTKSTPAVWLWLGGRPTPLRPPKRHPRRRPGLAGLRLRPLRRRRQRPAEHAPRRPPRPPRRPPQPAEDLRHHGPLSRQERPGVRPRRLRDAGLRPAPQ